MDISEIIESWQEQSADDLVTAQSLFANKRFAPCLFFVHLAIEKRLKADVVKVTNAPAPYTHDLVTLARATGYTLSTEQEDYLRKVNTFNTRARYDDIKRAFYKQATSVFTEEQLKKAEDFLLWLPKHS